MFVRKSKYDKLKNQLELLESRYIFLHKKYDVFITDKKQLLNKISELENQLKSKDTVIIDMVISLHKENAKCLLEKVNTIN